MKFSRTIIQKNCNFIFYRSQLKIDDLGFHNYSAYFNNLLYLEEHQMKKDIAQYTMQSVKMRKEARTGLAVLEVGA